MQKLKKVMLKTQVSSFIVVGITLVNTYAETDQGNALSNLSILFPDIL